MGASAPRLALFLVSPEMPIHVGIKRSIGRRKSHTTLLATVRKVSKRQFMGTTSLLAVI